MQALVQLFEIQDYFAGQTLYNIQDDADSMFVLLEGHVEVYLPDPSAVGCPALTSALDPCRELQLLVQYRPGAIFGECDWSLGQPRTYMVCARWALKGGGLDALAPRTSRRLFWTGRGTACAPPFGIEPGVPLGFLNIWQAG